MTEVFLIRHSKSLNIDNDLNNKDLQLKNEKVHLSLEGKKIASSLFAHIEFNAIDVLYSSNYVRAIETAEFLAEKNNLIINVDSNLGERKFGVSSFDNLPKDFERKQLLDENYKIGTGESQKEVQERMYNALMKILNKNKNKTIAIVSHATAITYLLKKWCDIQVINDKIKYCFKGEVLLDNYFDYCETFKLIFDDKNQLIDIINIKV